MPRSVFVAMLSLPSSIFLTRTIVIVKACVLVFGLWSSAFDVAVVVNLSAHQRPKTKDPRPKTHSACVAEQQKHLTVNQADLLSFVGASPTTCTRLHEGM